VSNYRQPTTIAFDAATAPTDPNALNDEFNASRPGIQNQPGLAVLSTKWATWDPGSVLTFKALDVRRQMLLMRTNGTKQWCGIMQNLPLPAVGHSIECAIYARVAFADIDTGDTFDPVSAGIVLGENLVASPDTSALRSVELVTVKAGNPATVQPGIMSQTYAGYDFPGTVLGQLTIPQDAYIRVRLKQALAAGPVWTVDAYFDVSASDGVGWIPLADQIGAVVPYRQVALGVRALGEVEVGHYFDFFRVELTAVDDVAATTGGAQTLGAV
jgi:hypothetical protein